MTIGGTAKGNLIILAIFDAKARQRLTVNAQLYSFRDTWRDSVLLLAARRWQQRGCAKGEKARSEVKIIDYSHLAYLNYRCYTKERGDV